MFITKKAISRRTILHGMGAALALPLLDAMVPAATALAQTAASPVRRLGFFMLPNGHNPVAGQWAPIKEGTDWDITPSLAPFEPFKDQLVIPFGLRHTMAESAGDGGGDHARACSNWLNGVRPKRTDGPNVRAGTTIDQMAAKEWGKYTKLASLETSLEAIGSSGACNPGFACGYQIWFSWSTPTTPLHHEPNPRIVFERLFGDGSSPAEQKLRLAESRSILDSMLGELNRLNKRLGNNDRATVDEYTTAIRDVERQIEIQEKAKTDIAAPTLPEELPDTFEEHAKVILDLQVLAFRGDITRVTTTLIGREQGSRSYTKSGVADGHHNMSHHQNDPEKLAKLTKIIAYLMKQPAYLFDKLKATPDGDGNLLDHSLFLVGGGLGDPNLHNHLRLPAAVIGGAGGNLKGGRSLHVLDQPYSNLLVSMLNKVGLPIDKVGDSTGPLVGM